MGIDPKYIRTHTQVIGEGTRWFLNKMERDWAAWNDELDRRELGQDELTAARTLDAAGWTLAPGEAHKLDALDAIARGDQAAAVRSRLAANVEVGHMTPVEASTVGPHVHFVREERQRVITEEPLSKEERLRRDLEDRIYHSLEKGDGEGVKESLAVYSDFCQEHEIPFKIEFNTRDLSGMDLSGLSLPGVRFSRCLLEGVSFKETNLERAVFIECEFGPNEFSKVQPIDNDVVWKSANLTEACFLDCSDLDRNLSGATIHNTEIDRRILLSAGIYNTKIEEEIKREEAILLKEEAEIMMMDEF